MKILSRYILREITQFFLLSLAVFLGILVTARMVKLTSLVINKGVGLGKIFTIYISIIPTFLEIAIPLSTLLGVMLAFARLSGDSEIIVMRSSGISINQLIRPVFVFGVLMAVAGLVVSLYLRPWGNLMLGQSLFEIASNQSVAGLNEGVFNRMGRLTLYAETIDYSSGKLEKVLVDDRRDETNRQIVVAKGGYIKSQPKDRTIQLSLYDGVIHAKSDLNSYNLTRFQTNRITIDPSADLENQKRSRPREMLIPELQLNIQENRIILKQRAILAQNLDPDSQIGKVLKFERSIREVQSDIVKLKTEIVRKFSFPFACLVMALIAMPLGIQPVRSQKAWGTSLSAALAIIVIVTYYGILSVGMTLAKSSTVTPLFGLWLPNLALLIVALMLIRMMRSEKWQTILHAFEHVLNTASTKLRV